MLGDRITTALPGLRAHARSRMTSVALVESVAVEADPMTGRDVETATVIHEAAPCRVKAGDRRSSAGDAAGATVTRVPAEVHFPWDMLGLATGLRVTITSSRSPVVVGNRYRLTEPSEGDDMTAQRWGVETWQQEI